VQEYIGHFKEYLCHSSVAFKGLRWDVGLSWVWMVVIYGASTLGTLLSATTFDGISCGICSGGRIVFVTWTWFLQYLKEALETELDNIIIISDQEKRLQGANWMLFPNA